MFYFLSNAYSSIDFNVRYDTIEMLNGQIEKLKDLKSKRNQVAVDEVLAKLKETAEKLARMESLYDPLDAPMGATPNAAVGSDDGTRKDVKAEYEKSAIFGKKNFKKS